MIVMWLFWNDSRLVVYLLIALGMNVLLQGFFHFFRRMGGWSGSLAGWVEALP